MITFSFVSFALLLGVGLAMDAFSVSVANGLREPSMSLGKGLGIAGTFGFFQALMPMLGWICVHTLVEKFASFSSLLPWISFLLLAYIGGEMLWNGIKAKKQGVHVDDFSLTLKALFMQGIATSIDAMSVGFTIGEYKWFAALVCALIIGVVTFVISFLGVHFGRKIGTKLTWQADVLGGVILIGIGIKILISGVLS